MEAVDQINTFQEFIEKRYKAKLLEAVKKGRRFLVVNFSDLSQFNPELANDLLDRPEEVIKAAELALDAFDLPEIHNFRIRFKNLPDSQKILIGEIRSNDIGKFVVVEGTIRQKSDVRPQVTSAKFECPSCGNLISVLQLDTIFKEPSRCGCGRKGKFRLVSKDLVDAQRIVLEENPEQIEGGAQPKRMSFFLKEDLVSPLSERRTNPGSKISAIGVIKEIPVILNSGSKSTRFDLIVEANYVKAVEETFHELKINKEEEKKIKELSQDPKLFNKLVESIAPAIFGYGRIKEALILQLMSGVRKVQEGGVGIRGDIHILLVGDPGSGKSQLLKRINVVAPKGRYVSGKGVSGAGLTATVVKDEFLRGWALEAGALVLASDGIACIDEMDKMSVDDTSAMHEALEQQTVSISKANVQATLIARTTVLAAANPKLGRFDPYGLLAEQIAMPPTLINRFDLIFPIKDLPNKKRDEKMARHILGLHQRPESIKAELETKFIRKYIAYAKQRITPQLTDAALSEIREYYVKMRGSSSSEEGGIKAIPISARQLEALIRLSEASARTRLSNKVTKKDAKRAISLVHYYLTQIGMDIETGEFDIDRISTGVPAAQRSKIAQVKEIIVELENKVGKIIPIEEIVELAKEKKIDGADVDEAIEKLKRGGDLFEPRRGFISRI
ncbi:minichromosome maintenance protein MCM [Candidatus Woesearchaeota archaeon]|nr:minichromosome maintenance protein MCM [Candidatus Woesearchaeota archaeon]